MAMSLAGRWFLQKEQFVFFHTHSRALRLMQGG